MKSRTLSLDWCEMVFVMSAQQFQAKAKGWTINNLGGGGGQNGTKNVHSISIKNSKILIRGFKKKKKL